MFKVLKTNKKTIEYNFNDLKSLDDWATKNRYTQGSVDFYINGVIIKDIRNCYNIASYCTKTIINEREKKNATTNSI